MCIEVDGPYAEWVLVVTPGALLADPACDRSCKGLWSRKPFGRTDPDRVAAGPPEVGASEGCRGDSEQGVLNLTLAFVSSVIGGGGGRGEDTDAPRLPSQTF